MECVGCDTFCDTFLYLLAILTVVFFFGSFAHL